MKFIILLVAICLALSVRAEEPPVEVVNIPIELADSTPIVRQQGAVQPQKRRPFFRRVVDYFRLDADSAAVDTTRRLRLGFIGGPSYASVSGLQLSVTCTATYRHRGSTSPLLQPSNAMAFAYITTRGFWSVGVSGVSILAGDRRRLRYELLTMYAPRDFWGIGYELGKDNSLRTTTKQQDVRARAELMWRVCKGGYVGMACRYDYANIGRSDLRERLWNQAPKQSNIGFGPVLQYDSRDLMTNASRGIYASLMALYRPAILGNHCACTTLEMQFDAYRRVWTGAVVAVDVRATWNFGDPSWAMLPLLGDSYSMRGYYEGRFRDRHMIAAQVELRQRVYRRSGIVAWVGAGTVFSNVDNMKNWLPNGGVGYRWEFRRNTNIRLDVGFGKHKQFGVLFSMNEAF